ncbi:MAG: hypothetical protein H8D23_02890 [Candidatus Brocadiales bacterium]|nr:hypothetical protein [Candidatus Brocadiales bacterium]
MPNSLNMRSQNKKKKIARIYKLMKPMAIPTVGGMAVVLIAIFIVPCCYCGLMELKLKWGIKDPRFEENVTA